MPVTWSDLRVAGRKRPHLRAILSAGGDTYRTVWPVTRRPPARASMNTPRAFGVATVTQDFARLSLRGRCPRGLVNDFVG